MKRICLSLVALVFSLEFSYAQWTTAGNNIYNTNTANVGIGTTTPGAVLDVGTLLNQGSLGSVLARLSEGNTTGAGTYLGIKAYNTQLYGNLTNINNVISFSIEHSFYGVINSSINFLRGNTSSGGSISFNTNNNTEVMRVLYNGYVGIGTTSPATRLHVVGNGATIDAGSSYVVNGDDLAIQGNTGGRSTTMGAQLEFVIPANTDGTNLWGQARIITVAGNANTADATGKMILGTRRMFNKLNTGQQWYYGNDLVIDGNGNVGIGTVNPGAFKLAVEGVVHAQQVNVDMTAWNDYVFKKDYHLPALAEVKTYIDKNHHLPEIPSEQAIAKDGLNLGEIDKLLTKKVEELTLYLIEKDQEVTEEVKKNQELEDRLKKLETQMQVLLRNK